MPGALHHIMVRGLDRKPIFQDDQDRQEFLTRLEKALERTGCKCYAWSLMSNHYHLLVRSGRESISTLMRRLQTGYAIYYNRRHRRTGYLYQNRYKSILCQEERYFLELIRYIHLNPLKAKIVKDIGELDRYKWSGHRQIMEGRSRGWQDVGEVLERFGHSMNEARRGYRQFVRDGLESGMDERWLGGGLVRSMGGWRQVLEVGKGSERWRSDERILGDGEFVQRALQQANEKLDQVDERRRNGWNIERLKEAVAKLFGIREAEIFGKSRFRESAMAKGVLAYYAYEKLGEQGASIARLLGISRPALTKAVLRGKQFIEKNDPKLIS